MKHKMQITQELKNMIGRRTPWSLSCNRRATSDFMLKGDSIVFVANTYCSSPIW